MGTQNHHHNGEFKPALWVILNQTPTGNISLHGANYTLEKYGDSSLFPKDALFQLMQRASHEAGEASRKNGRHPDRVSAVYYDGRIGSYAQYSGNFKVKSR